MKWSLVVHAALLVLYSKPIWKCRKSYCTTFRVGFGNNIDGAGLVGSVGCGSDWWSGGCGFDQAGYGNILSWRFDHEIFSTVILSLPLSKEGQLSVSGERMCTILVNHLVDYACSVKVWLGKLTTLNITPLGWLGHKTSTQIKQHRWPQMLTLVMLNILRCHTHF